MGSSKIWKVSRQFTCSRAPGTAPPTCPPRRLPTSSAKPTRRRPRLRGSSALRRVSLSPAQPGHLRRTLNRFNDNDRKNGRKNPMAPRKPQPHTAAGAVNRPFAKNAFHCRDRARALPGARQGCRCKYHSRARRRAARRRRPAARAPGSASAALGQPPPRPKPSSRGR